MFFNITEAVSDNDETKKPCDCYDHDCEECNARLKAEKEEIRQFEIGQRINDIEEREFERQIEGGDDDDYDEEDMHGSKPIDSLNNSNRLIS